MFAACCSNVALKFFIINYVQGRLHAGTHDFTSPSRQQEKSHAPELQILLLTYYEMKLLSTDSKYFML